MHLFVATKQPTNWHPPLPFLEIFLQIHLWGYLVANQRKCGSKDLSFSILCAFIGWSTRQAAQQPPPLPYAFLEIKIWERGLQTSDFGSTLRIQGTQSRLTQSWLALYFLTYCRNIFLTISDNSIKYSGFIFISFRRFGVQNKVRWYLQKPIFPHLSSQCVYELRNSFAGIAWVPEQGEYREKGSLEAPTRKDQLWTRASQGLQCQKSENLGAVG